MNSLQLRSLFLMVLIALIAIIMTTTTAANTPPQSPQVNSSTSSTATATPPLSQKLTTLQAQGLFVTFLQDYKKTYEVSDLFKRLNIFVENLQWMLDWNNDKSNTHQVGVNFFADLAPEEWSQYTGLNPPSDWVEPDYAKFDKMDDKDNVQLQQVYKNHPHLKDDQPADLNWNIDEYNAEGKLLHKAATLPIRDQLSCGSCYSYSTMASVEALYRINFNEENDPFEYFSTQQGLDCTGPKYGNSYCAGGWMMSTFQYLIDNKGVCWDKDYPYKNRRTTCQHSKCKNAFAFDKYVDVSGHTGKTLTKHIAVNPLAIGVSSSTREFMYYKSGIITKCGNAQVDHAVNAVAYSTTNAIPHMIGRNSWSERWGDNGAFRIALAGNACKWRSNVSYPVLTTPPKSLRHPQTPAI